MFDIPFYFEPTWDALRKSAHIDPCNTQSEKNQLARETIISLYDLVDRCISESYLFAFISGLFTYPGNRSPRGFCFIVNNMTFQEPESFRRGAEVDEASLKSLFQEMHFLVGVAKNLTQRKMETVFEEVAKRNHSTCDMFVGVVMTHGGQGDELQGSDGHMTSVKRITAAFLPRRCPLLAGKPKIFFFQSCRGTASQSRAQSAEDNITDACPSDSNLARSTFPHEADFLLAFSTPPGYVAYRDDGGSPYVQTLVNVVRECHQTTHLLDMLTEVNRRVAESVDQVPSPVHTLRGKVFI